MNKPYSRVPHFTEFTFWSQKVGPYKEMLAKLEILRVIQSEYLQRPVWKMTLSWSGPEWEQSVRLNIKRWLLECNSFSGYEIRAQILAHSSMQCPAVCLCLSLLVYMHEWDADIRACMFAYISMHVHMCAGTKACVDMIIRGWWESGVFLNHFPLWGRLLNPELANSASLIS